MQLLQRRDTVEGQFGIDRPDRPAHRCENAAVIAARLHDEDKPPSVTIVTDEGDRYVIGEGTTRVAGSRASVLMWLARPHHFWGKLLPARRFAPNLAMGLVLPGVGAPDNA